MTATLGAPGELAFVREGERVRWRPPPALRDVLADADLDATEPLRSSRIQVYLHSLRDGTEYVLPGDTEVELGADGAAGAHHRASSVEAATAAAGAAAAAGRLGGPRRRHRRRLLPRTLGAPQRRPARAQVVRASRLVARRAVLPRLRLARRLAARVPLLIRRIAHTRSGK